MDLIYKQDGLFSVHAQGILCLLHHILHVLLPRHGCVDLAEAGTGGVGNHLGQRGFSGSRRAIKDDGTKLVRLDGAVKQLVLSDDVLLPYHLVQRGGAHTGRQGRFLLLGTRSHIVKQIHVSCFLLLPQLSGRLAANCSVCFFPV